MYSCMYVMRFTVAARTRETLSSATTAGEWGEPRDMVLRDRITAETSPVFLM